MRVTCDNCQADYTVADDKLSAGQRLQFTCRRCNHRVVVTPPTQARASGASGASSESGAIAPTAASQEPRWFIANSDGSYQKLAESEARGLVEAGALSPETLVWKKGFGEWIPASETEPWATLLAARRQHNPVKTAQKPRISEVSARSELTGDHSATSNVTPSATGQAAPASPRPARSAGRRPLRSSGGLAPVAADRQSGGRPRRRITNRGLAAPNSERGVDTDRAVAAKGARVAGVGVAHTGQQAVSLPIVRPKQKTSSRLSSRSNGSGLSRFREGNPLQGTPMDGAAEQDPTAWAPATDTYIGPRDRFTHRIGSAAQREALFAQVDRETKLRRDVRRWQWVSLGTACMAIVAFTLAIVALLHQRDAELATDACRKGAAPPAITDTAQPSP